MKKMKVNVISESAFTVQGHGVHSAFTDTVEALRAYTGCDVAENSDRPADVVHVHTVGPYSLLKLLRARGATVVSAHVTPDSFVGSLAGAKYWKGLAAAYLRWFYNRADGVLAVSAEVMQELQRMGVKKPLFLVPNTIRTGDFATTPELRAAARKRLGVAPGAFVVLGSGQVQPRKRVDVFVDCARALPGVEFVWAGGMPFKGLAAEASAMNEVMESHPDNVRFTGLLAREEVKTWYRAADLFFLPSAQETFGIVIVEAAAAGLPVLLRDLEQYRDTFGDGYARGDDDSFAGIIRQFAEDRRYYERWQKAAQDIAQRYDAKAGAGHLLVIYRKVIAAHEAAHKKR